MPKELCLGYLTIAVEYKAMEGATGQYDAHPPRIAIAPEQRIDQEANTLLHESLHAMWDHFSLPADEEERCVTLLANGLTELIVRNPDLLKYLCRLNGD